MFLGSSEWDMFHLLKGASTEMKARLERERSGFFALAMPSLLPTDSRGCHSGVTWPSALGTVAKWVSQAQRLGVAWRTHFPLTCRGVIEAFPANVI